MTANSARVWLVAASLGIILATFVFFFVGPILGYPLEFEDARRMIEIIIPVFAAYLGSATRFLFNKDVRIRSFDKQRESLLGLLVKGPIIVFGVALAALLIAFGASHRIAARPGTGIAVDDLAGSMVLILSLLAVTTTAVTAYLFEGQTPPADK